MSESTDGRDGTTAKGRLKAWAAPRVRKLLFELDNPHVKRGRLMLKRLREDPPDIIGFGDSSWSFTSPHDEDRRTLRTMVHDELGAEVRMHEVDGGGYHPPLFSAFLHVVGTTDARPLIILPLCIRMRTVWSEHPRCTFLGPIGALREVEASWPLRKVRHREKVPPDEAYAAFDLLPLSTFAGDLTVGDHRRPLRDPAAHGLDHEARVRLLYAFYHGEALQPGCRTLQETTQLGQDLKDLGLRVVAYQTPVPVERGSELHGEQFRQRAVDNFALIDEAFLAGYGDTQILQTGVTFSTDEFLDPDDGTEHLNDRGRRRLAAGIAAAARRELADLARSAADRPAPGPGAAQRQR